MIKKIVVFESWILLDDFALFEKSSERFKGEIDEVNIAGVSRF
jgi:hypothetical protein